MLAVAPYLFCILLSGAVFVLWRKWNAAQGALSARAVAEAKFEQLAGEVEALRDALTAAQRSLSEAQKNEALALQKAETTEQRMREFEETKKQFEQYAKAAALTAGNEISTKLLADNQREREATYKQFEQFTKATTEHLSQRQQELAGALGKMQGLMDISSGQLSVLVRAMKNPIGAGAEGEITLDNLLQQLGLIPEQDYTLQIHLAGEENNLRPDGVIFLPNQQALVIDAKASQHIYALYEADGTPEADMVFEKLCATMRTHVKALAGKSYREAMLRFLKEKNRPAARAMLVMFVPNDEVVSRLRRRDPELVALLARHEIMLAGPSTLPAICLYAATMIREARQQDEQSAILQLTSALMSDLIIALSKADKVMGGLRTSAKAFDEFAGSVNRGVLSRMRRIAEKGLMPAKNQPIPQSLPRYDITKVDEVLTVEADEPPLLSLTKEDAA